MFIFLNQAESATNKQTVVDDDSIIFAPTLHIHGTRDAAYEGGKKQHQTFFEQTASIAVDINYHHAMPWHRKDLMVLANGMRELGELCLGDVSETY